MVAFELRDGLFRKVERVELIELGAKESCFVFGKSFSRGSFSGFAEQVVAQAPASTISSEGGGEAGMQIEHLQLGLGAHQLLWFAWAVEIDPQFTELLKLRERGRTAVD